MAKHDLGDLQKIRANLQDWLAARLPDSTNLVLDEPKFPEESGESSVTLLLTGQCAEAQARFVCRMRPPASQVFDSHDLQLQYRLMEIAAEAGVPVPALLGYEPDASLVGSDFYIMEYIDGQIPTDNPPYAFGSWVTQLKDSERARMWRNGIAAMAGVHRIDIQRYDLPTLPASSPDASPVQHEVEKFEALVTPGLAATLQPQLLDAFEYIKANLPADGPRRLCWGDSRPGNVIWRDLQPVALIDWEMASLADPLMDVSWWFWIDYVNSVGLGAERPGGLPALEQVYEQWHELTGLPVTHGDFYDLFSVVRYAIILERKFDAMQALGMDRIDNFCLPFVVSQHEKCLRG